MLLCVLPVLIRKLILAISGHMNTPGNHFSYLRPSSGVFTISRRGDTESGGSTASLGALGPVACSHKAHSHREKMFFDV